MATIHEINEDWQQHGLAATWLKLQKAQGEHDALAAELQKWRDVFGHLGTADECGNEWIRMQERISRLESAIGNLQKVKGRYHTEQAYNALVAALKEDKT